MLGRVRTAAVLVSLLALAAPASAQGTSPEPAAPAAAPPEASPVELWVDRVLTGVGRGALDELARLVDADALLDRATRGVGASKGFEKGFRSGARGNLLGASGLLGTLHEVVEGGGEVTFLRARVRDGFESALFRLRRGEDQGFDYHEYLLEPREGGMVAIDCYQYSRGETQAQALRRWYVPLAVEQNKSLIQRLIGTEHQLATHWKRVDRMLGAYREGELEEAERLYRGLPTALQRDKGILLLRIGATPAEAPEYVQSIATLIEHYPSDPGTILASIDHHWMRGELALTRTAIEELRKSIGGDPYLDHLEATLLLERGELDLAVELARKAIDGGLGRVDPYWVLLAVSLRRQDHARTLELLVEIDDGFEVEWQDFAGVPEYAGFLASPYHAQWLEHLAGGG